MDGNIDERVIKNFIQKMDLDLNEHDHLHKAFTDYMLLGWSGMTLYFLEQAIRRVYREKEKQLQMEKV